MLYSDCSALNGSGLIVCNGVLQVISSGLINIQTNLKPRVSKLLFKYVLILHSGLCGPEFSSGECLLHCGSGND